MDIINAIAGSEQRGVKPLDKLINSINQVSAVKIDKQSVDEQIKEINERHIADLEDVLLIRPTREELIDELADVIGKYAELRNLSTKKQLAELDFIIKREKGE